MINDIIVYSPRGGWSKENEVPPLERMDLLVHALDMPQWIPFIFQGNMYYKTFEDHIYRIVAIER